jgi:hypothetical protein
MSACEHCGAEIEQPATGRPKRFCSTRHRVAAFRAAHRVTKDPAVRVGAPRPVLVPIAALSGLRSDDGQAGLEPGLSGLGAAAETAVHVAAPAALRSAERRQERVPALVAENPQQKLKPLEEPAPPGRAWRSQRSGENRTLAAVYGIDTGTVW